MVKVFSFGHASSSIFGAKPVEVRQDVSFQKVEVHGFYPARSVDGRDVEVTGSA